MEHFVDYSRDRAEDLIDYKTLLEVIDPSLYLTLYQLTQKISSLPNKDIQIPVFLSYVLCPSAMATRMPLLFLYGESGSGKSSLGTLAAKIYGATILQASSTYAAIRNELNENKWITHPDSPDIKLEQNYLLVWDDIDTTRISPNAADNGIFTLLKSGISRSTSTIKIAVPGGSSMSFDTFGGKVISTIHAIWDYPGLEEFKRRSLPIFFKKKDGYAEEYIDVELLDITELELRNRHFWASSKRRELYRKAKKYFGGNRDLEIEKGTRLIMADLMATLYTHQIIHDEQTTYQTVLTQFQDYLNLRKNNLSTTVLSQMLKLYFDEKEAELIRANSQFMAEEMVEFIQTELMIESSEVYSFLRARMSDGSIDLAKLDNKMLHLVMRKEGFKSITSSTGTKWKRLIKYQVEDS